MPQTNHAPSFRQRLQNLFWGPQLLAFLPALCLAAYWLVGEGGLIACALGLPILWANFGGFDLPAQGADSLHSHQHTRTKADVDALFAKAAANETGLLMCIAIDDSAEMISALNNTDLKDIQDRLTHRYRNALRTDDLVLETGPLTWLVAIKPGPNLDLEAAIQQASRLQGLVEDPLMINEDRLYLTSCIGFSMAPMPLNDTGALAQQASIALSEAIAHGPDAIRAYAPGMLEKTHPKSVTTIEELNGDIDTSLTAWFQPQISTDTGHVCGFEALARWHTDEGELIAPSTFLPVLEQAGLMERLTELILSQSLAALSAWDKAGLKIETVGVNFSEIDLANPRIFDMIAWDLDRYNIAPHRLCIEVLESVVASDANDMIVRNVHRLADLGCQIDLDDFGTGHASISTLRRLPVRRLKIDRSFVAKADLDAEQQKMVATILMMAERLGLSSLAEGVETLGEHTILAQLGCRYVQGFGIARPMPFDATITWITDYQNRLALPPVIGRKSG